MHPVNLAAFATLLLAPGLSAQLGSLTTTFQSDNRRTITPPVNLMDLVVRNPNGLTFAEIDVNSMAAAGTRVDVEIWTTPVTYVGQELNPSAWTKLSEGSGIAQGPDRPTRIELADFSLRQGSHGIGVYYENGGSAYTNGSNTFGNSELMVRLGVVTGNFFASPRFAPRTWNGTWYYFVGNANYGRFGDGCPHSAGTPGLDARPGSVPRPGDTFALELTNLDPGGLPAIVLLGADRTIWFGRPLPFDLAPLGAPGCRLLVGIATTATVVNTGGTGTWSVGIPNDASLVASAFFNQALVLATGANALGAVVSNGGEGLIGR